LPLSYHGILTSVVVSPQPHDKRHPCLEGNCIGLLANNLTTIFITRLISGNLTAVVIPFAKHYWFKQKENKKEEKLSMVGG